MITILIYFLTFFTKKIYELAFCGAPGGRAADGTRKGCCNAAKTPMHQLGALRHCQ